MRFFRWLGNVLFSLYQALWHNDCVLNDTLKLDKFTLIITTRCNLRCELCCEYVPQHKPYPDMAVEGCETLLRAFFDVADGVDTLHLSGGGEPFLHPRLAELVDSCFKYANNFDWLMLFTNCTVAPSEQLINALKRYRDKIILQVSCYGVKPEQESKILAALESTGVALKLEKYYGQDQSFGGWVDFGKWEARDRTEDELRQVFDNCAVTCRMRGNWRARDGKVHWCSRSQRGMELGLIPDVSRDYVDLFDGSTREAKRAKFHEIAQARYLTACRYCSGDQGTDDLNKRFPAAEQL